MPKPGYFKVPCFDSLQRYQHKRPAWIKLHDMVLDDYELNQLPENTQLHFHKICLLAARLDNKIPLDADFVGQRIGAKSAVNLLLLVEHGLIEIIEGQLLKWGSENHSMSHTETDKRERQIRDRDRKEGKLNSGKVVYMLGEPSGVEPVAPSENKIPAVSLPKREVVPYQKILDLYHDILGGSCPHVVKLSTRRKAQISARWHQDLGELEEWANYFRICSESDFLMGRCKANGDRRPFLATLDWLINEQNLVKVIEGRYHR